MRKHDEESKEQQNQRMAWWREARFGMFIHWGLYAVPAGVWNGKKVPGIGEWIMQRARIPIREYELLAKRFNPVKFNAREWVRVAKDAGMKWIVITAKHHDGFCMFDTELTDYNIVKATPFKRDPLKELAEACKAEDIRLGFYYSQTLDWHHPDGVGNDWDYDPYEKKFSRYIKDYVKPQIRELLTNYSPVALLWFDISTPTPEISVDLIRWIRSLDPNVIISGRVAPFGEMRRFDYWERGDNEIPAEKVEGDWETPATINDTWGFKNYDHNWKSTGTLIHKLVEIVSKGGNYLLNVGPTAEGVIPQPSVDRLLAIGKWLKVNGESIYGTSAGPFEETEWGRCTAKSGKLYLHVLAWPDHGQIEVPRLKSEIDNAYLLSDPKRRSLKVQREGDRVLIRVPSEALDPVDNIVVVELEKKS